MANDDKPENADQETRAMQGPSEEMPTVPPEDDATAPNPALEPTEQDRPEEAARHDFDTNVKVADHKPETAHDHGLAHTMPIWMLLAVLGALMLLTFLTVSVTNYDLGSEGNLVVGMVIATIKASLVVTFFMHLFWDKKFHLILFLTAILFVILFLSMTVSDRSEYQRNIDLYQNAASTSLK
jgi:cytochrome c oxidase subunit 4